MLFILLACIYISFICLAWGHASYSLINKITSVNEKKPHSGILCLLGLVPVLIICQILSIFVPLGSWFLQILFLLPALVFFLRKSGLDYIKALKNDFVFKNPVLFLIAAICIILLLLMSSWKIIHPDTLGYHAQIIQWIEKYKAIPGLVHLHPRFGFQSAWFAANALFSFNFLNINAVTILNTIVLAWFVFFIIYKIDESLHFSRKYLQGIVLLLLFSLCFWSYTQIRLTATSASPDFISALFIWTSIIFISEKSSDNKAISSSRRILASIFGISSVIIKLSAIPILIIPAFCVIYFLNEKKIKLFFLLIAISFLAFIPFMARNIISSGYLIYPSTAFNIIDTDWKYDAEHVQHEKNYITSYARTHSGESKEEIDRVITMPYSEWIPVWWSNQSIADKLILILIVATFLLSLFHLKKILASSVLIKIAFFTSVTGIIFWFVNAPDPRFGFGFLVGFLIIFWKNFLTLFQFQLPRIILSSLLMAFLLAISAYTVYRFGNFYSPQQLLIPAGIEKNTYTTFDCNGLKINSPLPGIDFGNIPVPCTDLKCGDFIPGSDKITDGFKAK